MEPFVIAHHNAFYGADHRWAKLLEPPGADHRDQLLAGQTLVAPKAAFTDTTLPGTRRALELFLAGGSATTHGTGFVEDLASRGSTSGLRRVKDYYYSDDGFKIWHALDAYIKDVVTSCIRRSGAVRPTPCCSELRTESSDPDRADSGFFRARLHSATLVRHAPTIVFQASRVPLRRQLPADRLLVLRPNRPDSTCQMPEGDDEISHGVHPLSGMRASSPATSNQFRHAAHDPPT